MRANPPATPPASTVDWSRRWFFWAIATLMASLELMFVLLEVFRVDVGRRVALWGGVIALPILVATALVLVERRRGISPGPPGSGSWALVGAVMLGLLAATYFLVGRVPEAHALRTLDSTFEARIPLRPAFSLLYILLYPIFLLPFLVVRDRAALRRLVAADLMMFAICTAFFMALPVSFERPPRPPPVDLGSWVLGLIWSNDVSWNCLPSEHCMSAMIAALVCWEANRKVGAFALLAALAIGVSTLFTKQHYLVDVVSGYAIAAGLHFALRWARSLEALPSGVWDRLLNR